MNRAQERDAWTQLITGEKPRKSKYNAKRTGKYASKYESEVAATLKILEKAGAIRGLREQVPITLVEGRGKIRPIKYIADFYYRDTCGFEHWVDAKGCKTAMYKLKKKMAELLKGIVVEEV